jgi:hypothetical protein
MRKLILIAALAFAGGLLSAGASAEPYIAVQKGMQCSACHTNPAGGGKRTAYGNVYAQTELPADRIGDSDDIWNGQVLRWLSVGGNLRAGFSAVDTPNQDSTSTFDINRGTFYAEVQVIPERLSVYIDQQFAPGSSLNREAYVRINSESKKWHLMAGQFFLPYGLRVQDDTAFTRLVTGVNFFNPDRGVMVGYESGSWSTQLSLSNGSGGSGDTDDGKQVSFITNYVRPTWRVGGSVNFNDTDAGDRQMQTLFAGVRTGQISWLAEIDLIHDDIPVIVDTDSVAGLIEGNWLIRRGNNLKISYDYFDPDDDLSDDDEVRWSILYEYTPMQFLQSRFGLRVYDGIPQVDAQNRDEAFIELHGFF